MPVTSGQRLGSYEVIAPIGKGGMGEVWRARDTKLGREVAIKALPDEFARDEDRLARFEREAKVLASLNHPGIAVIHGLEDSDGTRFLVLELVEGDTLADRLKRGSMPIEEALGLALKIAEALEAAHAKGVIHRDLKPANIKVTPGGEVKVLDFGLAKAFGLSDTDANLSNSPTLTLAATRQGVILGTAAYMSPEQARGDAVDVTTDIWAFGCVLFEMLAGRQAFEGRTVSDIVAGVLAREPKWNLLPATLHPRARFLLERCLEKEANDRYRNIAEVRAEIRKTLADPAGVLAHSTVSPAPAPWRTALPWLAAVVLALIAGLAAWNLRPEAPRAVARFSQEWPASQPPRNVGRPVLAFAPDGSRFVYNTAGGLFVRELHELEARLIAGTQESSTNPFFSPDGRWVGYYSTPDGELQRISVSGGAPVVIAAATNPFGASWGPGDAIVFGQADGVMRVPATGGVPELIVATEDGEQVYGPQVLPGGEWVLFSLTASAGDARWDAASVVAASLETGERRVLIEGGADARFLPTGHLVYAFERSLFAVPFDLGSLEVTGGPVSIAEGLARAGQAGTGAANYGVSDNGTLVQLYTEGADDAVPETSLVFADRRGDLERIDLRPAFYSHARVSPDGTRLAVQVAEAGGRTDVWIYDLDGATQTRRLTQGGNSSRPIWTPDGDHVTFLSTRDGTPSLWWQKADASAEAEQLTKSDGPVHWPEAWSPDGRTLLFNTFAGTGAAEAQGLWTLSLDGDREPELFVSGYASGGAFSPDGRWIAYQRSYPENVFDVQIFVKPFPVSGPERPVTQDGGAYPVFSPTGRELLYRRPAPTAGGPGQTELVSIAITTEGVVTYGSERVIPIQGLPARFGVRDYDPMPRSDRLLLMLLDGGENAPADLGIEFRVVLNWFEELKARVPVP